jgi:hypothetical protein
MKAYICCTKEKFHGKNLYIPDEFDCFPDDESSKPYFAKEPVIEEVDRLANGSIVAECEVKEAFKYDFVHRSGDSSNFYIRDQRTERMKDCLSNDDLFDYGKGKDLYAYHLEHVNPIELHLSDFYEDEDCTKPLTKAPQSYRFAYHRHDCTDEEALMINKWSDQEGHECFQDVYGWYYVEKCLIFSDHPEYCAKILNGEKDLEVRKTRIAEGVTFK